MFEPECFMAAPVAVGPDFWLNDLRDGDCGTRDYIYRMNHTERGAEEMMCSFATLDETSLDIVRRVESETRRTILAYDCFSPETINEEEASKIREAEKKLCRTLVAVKTDH